MLVVPPPVATTAELEPVNGATDTVTLMAGKAPKAGKLCTFGTEAQAFISCPIYTASTMLPVASNKAQFSSLFPVLVQSGLFG